MKLGDGNHKAKQQQRDGSKRRKTPQERDQDFRADVEGYKRDIQSHLDTGHVMLVGEHRDSARRDSNYALLQAIEEMSSDMRESNRRLGGSRRWVDEAIKEASKADREARKRAGEREVARIAHEARAGASGVGGLAAANDAPSEDHNPGARFPTRRRRGKRSPIGAPGKGYNPGAPAA